MVEVVVEVVVVGVVVVIEVSKHLPAILQGRHMVYIVAAVVIPQ